MKVLRMLSAIIAGFIIISVIPGSDKIIYAAEPGEEQMIEDLLTDDTSGPGSGELCEGQSEEPLDDDQYKSEVQPDEASENGFEYTIIDGSAKITGYTGVKTGKLTIPEKLGGYDVTAIGEGVFLNCAGFTGEVVLPKTLKTIGAHAFEGCRGLNGLVLNEGLTTIGSYAFANCSGLFGNIGFPASITDVDDHAFKGCSAITGADIGKNIETIEEGTFEDCAGLKSIVFPADSKLSGINMSAFSGCSSLATELKFPQGLTTIGANAFSGCSSVPGIYLPQGLKEIGVRAFSECSSVKNEVTIPAGLTILGEYAFTKCGNNAKLILSEGLSVMGDFAFYRSGFAGKITIPASLTTIPDSAFRDSKGITSIEIKSGVAVVASHAFDGCTKLSGKLVLPATITVIDTSAFAKCAFKGDLSLPASLTTIADDAFFSCNLFDGTLTIPANVVSAGAESFRGMVSIRKIINSSKCDFNGSCFINDDTVLVNTGTGEEVDAEGTIKAGTYTRKIKSPSISSLSVSKDGITVKISKVYGASGYVLERRKSGGKWKKITDQENRSYTDKKAKSNAVKFEYRVYAYKDYGSYRLTSSRSKAKPTYYVSGIKIKSLENSSKEAMTIKWSKNSKCSGYQIQYSLSSKFKRVKNVNVSGKNKLEKKIKKLSKKKHYYVRVRAYKKAGNKKYYSEWSATKKVKIKK